MQDLKDAGCDCNEIGGSHSGELQEPANNSQGASLELNSGKKYP